MQNLLPVLRNGGRFVLTTHVNPDGDAIGSELALAGWLLAGGRVVKIINHSPTPAVFAFLDPENRIEHFDRGRHEADLQAADVIVVLDANDPARVGDLCDGIMHSPATRVCIDHHPDPEPFAPHILIDEEATSTGEIVYRLLVLLDGPALAPAVAQALYCAIMTDTGSFRYPRVDPEIHRIVAHLVERGADPVGVFHQVYEQWTPGRFRLLGAMLEGMETAHDGRLVLVSVTREMLRRTGTEEEDTDNFTVYPMSVRGSRAAILFLELPDGVKISFRSRGDIPINRLAAEFGGNGHRNAAGARLPGGDLAAVRASVVAAAGKYLSHEPPRE